MFLLHLIMKLSLLFAYRRNLLSQNVAKKVFIKVQHSTFNDFLFARRMSFPLTLFRYTRVSGSGIYNNAPFATRNVFVSIINFIKYFIQLRNNLS